MRNILVLITLLLLILTFKALAAPSYDSTGNPLDTASGTKINFLATNETLAFQDYMGNQMVTVEPDTGNDTFEVMSTFGYSGLNPLSEIFIYGTPGDTIYDNYAITHEGNVNDPNFKFTSYFSMEGGAKNWVVQLVDGSTVRTLEAGVISIEAITFPDDTDRYYQYRVKITSEVSSAPDYSYVYIRTTAETTGTPAGKYYGGNLYTYSGWALASDEVWDYAQVPHMTITRSSTVDAPIAYKGKKHDSVPGSVITYDMYYGNNGGASAEGVILVNKVPTNSRLAHFDNSGATTSVTIEAPQGNAVGWRIYYSTSDNPSKKYGSYEAWTFIGTLEPAGKKFPGAGILYLDSSPEAGAKWVKWEKSSVDLMEFMHLTWGVNIR